MRRRAFPATAFSVALAVICAGIFLHPDTDTADVDLHDGGIWVANQSANLVGHVNYQSRTLDGGFLANSTSYDILQHEGDVMLENLDQSSLSTVDTAAMAFVGGTPARTAMGSSPRGTV